MGELLPQAAAKLEPAPPATKPSPTTEDHALAIVRAEPTLQELGEEGLKVVLKRVFSLVGLRAKDLPTGGDKELLHRHILKHYGRHTQGEVEMAFELALTGKLGLDPKDVQVYDQFTPGYFARILNAYRTWAGETLRAAERKRAEPEDAPPGRPTDEAMEEWLATLKAAGLRVDFMPLPMYEWLVEKGRLAPTRAEKLEYLERAVAYRQGQLIRLYQEGLQHREALKAFNAMKDKGEFTGPEVGVLKALAKKMLLYDYINNTP